MRRRTSRPLNRRRRTRFDRRPRRNPTPRRPPGMTPPPADSDRMQPCTILSPSAGTPGEGRGGGGHLRTPRRLAPTPALPRRTGGGSRCAAFSAVVIVALVVIVSLLARSARGDDLLAHASDNTLWVSSTRTAPRDFSGAGGQR